MRNAIPCELPADALLNRYSESGAHADCYVAEIAGAVSHAEFVEAFYTTGVFKLERLILRLLVSRPSTDTEARELAQGNRDSFAAWAVEARAADQLLLADFTGRTKSWLMVAAPRNAGSSGTRLFFGSAVVPVRSARTGRSGPGFVFKALLGFHRLYSRMLLNAAVARLARRAWSPTRRSDDRLLVGLLLAYTAASLAHFTHNAEYLGDYPNLPDWLTRAGVYLAWCGQAALGLLGYVLYRLGRRLGGLAVLGIYAVLGFDGLLHYTRAPVAAHTAAMNVTIGFEVVTAALLLICVVTLASARIRA